MLHTTLADDDPYCCVKAKTYGKCQRASNAPMRYVRAFLRPAFNERTPVIHLVILRTIAVVILVFFIGWELFGYDVYMKGAKWSSNDVDFVAWILKPSSWSTINVFVLEISLIYAATFIYENKDNPCPIKESECLTPRLYLRIQHQFIVARVSTMLLFIVYMHSIQFNAHKDHAEEACTIMVWIVMIMEQLYGAIPAHFRDILISQTVVLLVIVYVCIMSAAGVSIYTGINLRAIEEKSIQNIVAIILISIWTDFMLVIFNKIKTKMCNIVVYTPPQGSEEAINLRSVIDGT